MHDIWKIIGSCKKCGSKNIRPVNYGMDVPTESINGVDINARGEVLGGCMVGDDSPQLICLDCGEVVL